MQQEMSIGHALAYLAHEIHAGRKRDWPELNEKAQEYVQSLRDRWEWIRSDQGSQAILTGLPKTGCQTDQTYLNNNDDFFVARLLVCRDDEHGSDFCVRLFGHLNDCYRCFEEFCQVLRDFYQMNQKLLTRLKE
ncbi:hypothetical protein MJD09_22870 [bacterium]|nr:hypothetical protein [bacterium]